MENLPATTDPPSNKVLVLPATPSEAPAIFDHLRNVRVDGDVLERQRERYKSFKNPTPREAKTMHTFAALGEGEAVIDLHATLIGAIKTVGFADSDRAYEAALAIGRPCDRRIWCRVHNTGRVEYYNQRPRRGPWYVTPFYTAKASSMRTGSWTTSVCSVPHLPREVAEAYPEATKRKSPFLLVWEGAWDRVSAHVPRPRITWDPALLEHLSGTLYVVRAAWDLTAVEAAALGLAPEF